MKKRDWIVLICALMAVVLTAAAASADVGDEYKLTTDASELHNGDRIILVSDDGNSYQAMATDFSGVQVTVSSNTIIEQDGMLVLTLTETEGGWILATTDGYLAADNGVLTVVSDSADAAAWSIAIASDGTATISCAEGNIVFAEQDGAYRFCCGEGGNELSIYQTVNFAIPQPFGNNLWWTFDGGKLTVGGNGAKPGFNDASDQPWANIRGQITEVEIQNGVTSIGHVAFSGCTGLTDVYYHGTRKTRERICIDSHNAFLTGTTWHYLSPVSIEMKMLPNQLEYREGESLDVTGGAITTYYDYDIVEEETITPDMITGFDSTIGGTKTLTVTYEGKTTSFEVFVYAPTFYGDANFDGKVTSADAAVVLRSIVGLDELPILNALNADVDGDGEIMAADAALILRYVVNLIDTLPAAE